MNVDFHVMSEFAALNNRQDGANPTEVVNIITFTT